MFDSDFNPIDKADFEMAAKKAAAGKLAGLEEEKPQEGGAIMEILKIDVAGAPGPDGAAGESGSAGSDGQSGDRGQKGKSGKNGKSGANGSSARNGRDGGKGSHGVKLEIEIGSDKEGDYICKTNRGNLGPGLYGFDASGGDGGSGGNGGHGGGGGDGGSGGAGGPGASGKSGKRKKDGSKGPGTKGKDGGNGGNGGNGGKGGNGGDGGDGQNGGNGADITLRASDLLALNRVVRLDARGGVAGRAGSRGAAGTAGSAGSAGTAGSGGSGGSGSPSGSRGASGNRGAGGTVGLRGQGGAGGASGSAGSNGRVFVKVKDGNRELSKEYVGFAQRHDLFGVRFALRPQKVEGVQDGVLSPGDTFQIKGMVGLPADSFPLPGEGSLRMRKEAEAMLRIAALPAIRPGKSVGVATPEIEVPKGQIGKKFGYTLEAYDSLDVPFTAKGGLVEIEPTWPVQVEFSEKEIVLASGGVRQGLKIRLKNVSSITYGDEEHPIGLKVQVEGNESAQCVKFIVDGGDPVDQITLGPALKSHTEMAYELIVVATDEFSSSHQINLKMNCNNYSLADKIDVKHDAAVKDESKHLFSPKVGRYLISPWVAVYNSRRMNLLFTAASAVLWADGTSEKGEQEVFFKVLKSIKLRERQKKKLADLIKSRPSKFQLRSMMRNTYPPDHLAAYAFATHMALADGELQESELKVLAWMEEKFKIDEARAGEVRKIAEINHKTFGFRVVDLYMSTISSWTMLAKVPIYTMLMGVFGLFVGVAKYSAWLYDVIRFDKVPELAVEGEAKSPDRALMKKILSVVVLGGLAGGGFYWMAPRFTTGLSVVRASPVVKEFEAYLNTLGDSLLASDQEVESEGKLAPAPGVLMSVDETQQWLSSGAKWHEAAWRASGCPEQVDRGWVADPNKRADFYRVIRTDVKLLCGTE